jgi:hypothetical protein
MEPEGTMQKEPRSTKLSENSTTEAEKLLEPRTKKSLIVNFSSAGEQNSTKL